MATVSINSINMTKKYKETLRAECFVIDLLNINLPYYRASVGLNTSVFVVILQLGKLSGFTKQERTYLCRYHETHQNMPVLYTFS